MPEYIEREAFLSDIEKRYCEPCIAEGKDYNRCVCRACWVDDMMGEIGDAPFYDVAPVVHGYWIPSESDFDDDDTLFDVEDWCDWQCSACHTDICYEDPMERRFLPKFCPNCGARMDGDKDAH